MKVADAPMSISVSTNLRELNGARPAWDDLALKHGSYTPFLCYDWFDLWLKHFGRGTTVMTLQVREGHDTAVLAPLMKCVQNYKGLQVRKIEFIGNVYSPIKGLLFSDNSREGRMLGLGALIEYFSRNDTEWDIIDLNSMAEENGEPDHIRAAAQAAGFGVKEYHCFENYYLDGIDCSGDEYMQSRPGNIRENVPYRKRKLQRTGDLRFMLVKDDRLEEHMDRYYELYSKSWKKEEHVGPTFHRDFARMAAKNGWLRLGFLLLDGIPMACQFWINAYGHAYILKLFYDEAYQQYAPGKILSVEMFRYAIDSDRVHTIDYLQGDEPYKKDWTPKKRSRRGVVIYNKTAKGKALEIMEGTVLPLINRSGGLKRIKDAVAGRLRQAK